jgi:hypothetical protein
LKGMLLTLLSLQFFDMKMGLLINFEPYPYYSNNHISAWTRRETHAQIIWLSLFAHKESTSKPKILTYDFSFVKPNYSLTVAEWNISDDLISGGDVNITHRVLHRAGMFLPKWQCNRLATDRSDTYSASNASGRTS